MNSYTKPPGRGRPSSRDDDRAERRPNGPADRSNTGPGGRSYDRPSAKPGDRKTDKPEGRVFGGAAGGPKYIPRKPRVDREDPENKGNRPERPDGNDPKRDQSRDRRDQDRRDQGGRDPGGRNRMGQDRDAPRREDREDRPARPRPPKPEPAGMPARRSALDILRLTGAERTLDEALEECRSFNDLEGPDRGFARMLATTALRRRGTLDHVIGEYVDRPLPKRAYRIMSILRIVGAQSIFLDTPPHAVVSTAVALAQDLRETAGYANMVNAVSRRICENGKTLIVGLPPRIDTPGWLWRRWDKTYGPTALRALAEAHQKEAPIDLTPKDPNDADALAELVGGAVIAGGSVRLASRAVVPTVPGFKEGRWWVQDAAAALPAKLLGAINGKRVYDLCAAPGGKTQQLAAAGAHVVAVDQAGPRLKVIVDNLARTQLKAETVKSDVIRWGPTEKADAVLLDAPCSATGTIRRHPDILWGKTEDDVKGLARVQSQMLDRALGLVKPGGVVVYCVCSLQPEEGEDQITALLKKRQDVERIPVDPAEIGGLTMAVTKDGDLRTMPSMLAEIGGMDGFFASRLRLKEGNR